MNIDHLRNTADRNILSAVFLYILLLPMSVCFRLVFLHRWRHISQSVAFGKDNPGPVGCASLSGSGTEKSSSPGLRYFSAPAPAPRAYDSSRGNRPVRDI